MKQNLGIPKRESIPLIKWTITIAMIYLFSGAVTIITVVNCTENDELHNIQAQLRKQISDRLQFVRDERTDPTLELTDFKIKYYSLQKEYDELLEKCPAETTETSSKTEENLVVKILENRNEIDKLRVQISHLRRTRNRNTVAMEMEERLKNLRWIRMLIKTYEQEKESKGKDNGNDLARQLDLADNFDKWLAQLQTLEVDFDYENPKLRSALVQEVSIGSLLDYPELQNLAYILYENEKYMEALGLHEIIYNRENATLGPSHPSTLRTQANLILCLDRLKEYGKALNLLRIAYDIQSKIYGPNHEKTLLAEHNIARGLHSQGNYKEAIQLYKQVYEKQVKFVGPYHRHTQVTKANMEHALSDLGI